MIMDPRTILPKFLRILLCGFVLVSALACSLSLTGTPQVGDLLPAPGPQVTIQLPFTGTDVQLGNTLLVNVIAEDQNNVVRIDLYVDDEVVLTQTSPDASGVTPLFLTHGLLASKPGTFSLMAKAYNTLGESGLSMAVAVTVVEPDPLVAAPPETTVQYIVQENETLEQIAQKTGSSAAALQELNPGLPALPTAGQVIVVPQPQVQPPALFQAAGPEFNILGGLQPWLILGMDQPQMLPPDQLGVVLPSLAPAWSQIETAGGQGGISGLALQPKINLISVSSCKVKIAWTDASPTPAPYVIYRRLHPNQPTASIIANVSKNTKQYTDTVSMPGTYYYEVARVVNSAPVDRSGPLKVEVKVTDCLDVSRKVLHIYFQPVTLTLRNTDATYAALWYSVNDSPARRIPAGQGEYHLPGDWLGNIEVLPAPTSIAINPDQEIVVKVWASGGYSDNRNPTDLGTAYNTHRQSDILGRSGGALYIVQGSGFELEYKIWTELTSWTGQGTTQSLPKPTNLRITQTTNTSRQLAWDWSGKSQDIEGFILYRAYNCPGSPVQNRAAQMIPAGAGNKAEVPFTGEPVGCRYRYQVSAYGRSGESNGSNTLEGDTQPALAAVRITLSRLEINSFPDPSNRGVGEVRLQVNRFERISDNLYLSTGPLVLSTVPLSGSKPNNSLTLAVAPNEFITVGYIASEVVGGTIYTGSICSGFGLIPPVNAWSQPSFTQKIRSTSCELIVEVNSLPGASATTGGSQATPTADLAVEAVARIGDQIYARVKNLGPDDLPNNRVQLFTAEGKLCGGAYRTIYLANHTVVQFQSNLPQWVYLGQATDRLYRAFLEDGWAWDLNPNSGCEPVLHIQVSGEVTLYDDVQQKYVTDPADFIDPDPVNNILDVLVKNGITSMP